MKRISNSDSVRVALIHGARAGLGGLGHSVASAITALTRDQHEVHAFGPGYHAPWPLPGGLPPATWNQSPQAIPGWRSKYTSLRWRRGELTFRKDRALGEWAATEIAQLRPQVCYAFTQVGLETLRWAQGKEVFTVLDNPNGHIRNFSEICERESIRWCGARFNGHPNQAMIDRVEQEYDLADFIRVYSQWGKKSMLAFGVPAEKVQVIQQTINLQRLQPPAHKPPASGPLRVCYVGSVDLRKGFAYLLRAMRLLGPRHVVLDMVGATGDRHCARLLEREKQGLEVRCEPGDPIRAYHASEIFVVPTLEDGLPFVLPEAMACGLPVIATDQCGAAECIRPEVEGWVVPAGNVEALAAALEKALQRRQDLPEMGRNARSTIEDYCGPAHMDRLAGWIYGQAGGVRESRDAEAYNTGKCHGQPL